MMREDYIDHEELLHEARLAEDEWRQERDEIEREMWADALACQFDRFDG